MRLLMVASLAGLFAATRPSTTEAQYRRQRGDTLRYRVMALTADSLESPQGTTPLKRMQDAFIGLVFGTGDTATAWYDTLRLAVVLRADTTEFDTRQAIHQPILLGVDPRGRVTIRAVPDFPPWGDPFPDLTYQFADFFLDLPSDLRLFPGRTWADTIIEYDSTPGSWTNFVQRFIDCTVTGDTVLHGLSAQVIRASQHIEMISVLRVPGEAPTTGSHLDGFDSALFLFAADSGLLLAHRHRSQFTGTMVLEGGRQRPVRRTYLADIELLR